MPGYGLTCCEQRAIREVQAITSKNHHAARRGPAPSAARAFHLSLPPDQVVADITSGTKSMSIGLAYVRLPETRQFQFMRNVTTDSRDSTNPRWHVPNRSSLM